MRLTARWESVIRRNDTTPLCIIDPNPDVTGTGIRASIYTLCLAAGILKTLVRHATTSDTYAEFAQALNSALQLQGLALLCTAIYQTKQRQLTLFHAICVLHLLSLLGVGLVPQGRYRGGLNRHIVLAALRTVVAVAFIGLVAYIWATAPTFGSQPDCNASTVYVVFGVSVRASEDVFRFTILALLVVLSIGWAVGAVALCCFGRMTMRLATNINKVSTLTIAVRPKRDESAERRDARHSHAVELLVNMGVNIYMVVTLEQTISRNNLSPEEQRWTFGQVLAIFLLLGVVVEVLNAILVRLDELSVPRIDEQERISLPPGIEDADRGAAGLESGPNEVMDDEEADLGQMQPLPE